jgi:acetyl esterase/lipase
MQMLDRVLTPLLVIMLVGLAPMPALAADRKPATRPIVMPPDSIQFTRDIVYGKGGDRELMLNLSCPKHMTEPLPCVLLIHGGGWSGGNRQQLDEASWHLAEHGYVAATVSYRLAPDAVWPAQINDVKCAVRFLRANFQKYKIDPNHFGAVGLSAGAHLAMLLGTTDAKDGLEGDGGWADQSSKVQAVVSFFGPTDLTAPELLPDLSPVLKRFLGAKMSEKPDLYKQASPVNHVTHDSAPMFLLQGTVDPLVNWKQAVKMAEVLTRNDVDGRLELLFGLGHGWGGSELKRTANETYAFLDEKLKPPAKP